MFIETLIKWCSKPVFLNRGSVGFPQGFRVNPQRFRKIWLFSIFNYFFHTCWWMSLLKIVVMTLNRVKSLQIVNTRSLITIHLNTGVPQRNFDCVKGSTTFFWGPKGSACIKRLRNTALSVWEGFENVS